MRTLLAALTALMLFATPVVAGDIASRSNRLICNSALEPGGSKWDPAPEFRDEIAEAKRRGLTRQQCASMLGRTTQVADAKAEQERLAAEARASKARTLKAQTALQSLNIYRGPLDGVVGPKTQSALGRWYRDNSYGSGTNLTDEIVAQMQQQAARQIAQAKESEDPLKVAFKRSPIHRDDIAVVIGNGNYKKQGRGIPNVDPAHADARAIKRWLMLAKGVREGNIIHVEDATGSKLESVFGNERSHKGQLFNWTKKNRSNVYIYYAGHGVPGEDDDAYLVPTDAEKETVQLTGYPLSILYDNLRKLPAKSIMVILEACFSGSSQAGLVVSRTSAIVVKPRVPEAPGRVTVITAGSAGQVASWEKDGSHSLFTKYFLLGLSGKGDERPFGNGDGNVSYAELEKYLEDTTTYFARRYYGHDQQASFRVGM